MKFPTYTIIAALAGAWLIQWTQITELKRQNDYLRSAVQAADVALGKANDSLRGSATAMRAAGQALELCRDQTAGEWIEPPATSPAITWRGDVPADVANRILGVERAPQ